MQEIKEFLLEYFDELSLLDKSTMWLLEKDELYAQEYWKVLYSINQLEEQQIDDLDYFLDQKVKQIEKIKKLYTDRANNKNSWRAPKMCADNELIHNEEGKLIEKSIENLNSAVVDETRNKLRSDTGKIIEFEPTWYSSLRDFKHKSQAIKNTIDFIKKFVEPGGWRKYFVNNIGKNDNIQIHKYHPMSDYNKNKKPKLKIAILHLGGNNYRTVILKIETSDPCGEGEPNRIIFSEVGSHQISDKYEEKLKIHTNKKIITEADTPEDLAELFDLN